MNNLRIFDHNIFYTINNLAGKNQVIDSIAKFLATNYFVALWCLIIAIIWFFYKKYRWNTYLAVASAIISRGIIVEIIKRIIDRPRPYEALANMHKLFNDSEHGASFPSGHTVVYFSFAFAFRGTKLFWPFFILATVASVDRVFVGVHYPADIIGGFLVAWATVWGIERLFKKRFLS